MKQLQNPAGDLSYTLSFYLFLYIPLRYSVFLKNTETFNQLKTFITFNEEMFTNRLPKTWFLIIWIYGLHARYENILFALQK